jgi:Flp pilus assembly protein TadG
MRPQLLGRGENGSASLEMVIVSPAMLLLLGLVIVAARLESAGASVEHAAAAAAREASLARTPAAAVVAARASVGRNLQGAKALCQRVDVSIDASGFSIAAGKTATVAVTVSCLVVLADQAVPGMPGNRTLTYRAVSPLDRFRSR